uniref:Uncharacterized protein n=1 Tax=candidate division WOR-3 bacterium TaxID=2052148 RepID=A0A7C4XLZ2_UNCW3
MVDEEKIKQIKREIAKRFPDFRDVEPKVVKKTIQPQRGVYKKLALEAPAGIKRVFSLKFKKTVRTVDAVKINRILVVTVDESGEIIKISQSR